VDTSLGGGHYQNKRQCKAEPSAGLVLVRTSPRALHHVITGAGFFSLAPSGYHGKKRAGHFTGSAFVFQNDLHSFNALLLEISGMYAASHPWVSRILLPLPTEARILCLDSL